MINKVMSLMEETGDNLAGGVGMMGAPKLNRKNYHAWNFSMKMMLIGRDLWDLVEGSEVLPERATGALEGGVG